MVSSWQESEKDLAEEQAYKDAAVAIEEANKVLEA